jgi:hypothetical protein
MDYINPDPSIVKRLKTIDPKLGVKFNGRNFVMTYERATGEPANIHLVKRDDGGFRQPDQRDIDFIRSFDMNNESCRERLLRLSQKSEKIREDLRKRAKDDIRHATLDNKRQLVNAFTRQTNQGKGNASFRRVTPKSKNVVATI